MYWLYKDLWWSNVAVKRPLSRPPTYFDARERDYIVFQTGFNGWAIFLRLDCFFSGFIYPSPLPPNLLIIILFQDDNIFGTIANVTYVLRYKDIRAFDNNKKWKLFTVCTEQVRSPYIEHAASGLPNSIRLEGEVRFVKAQDQQVLPHVVREW